MKQALIATILMVVCSYAYAQPNLVPNGDFENYSKCPTYYAQLSYVTGWADWNSGTVDYYNSCYPTAGGPGVPNNPIAYQYPASGNAYIGLVSSTTNVKEYAYCQITPMQIGKVYEVSLSVCLAEYSQIATNDIGVFFYDQLTPQFSGVTIPTTNGSTRVAPQVLWPGTIISDTQNWSRMTMLFKADSAYRYMAVGGFLPSNVIQSTRLSQSGSNTYYLIDSVVVKLYDSLSFSFSDTVLCGGDTLTVPYFVRKKKNANNTFTIQLSNAAGSFASPVSIGSIASDTTGVIKVSIPSNTPTGTGYKVRIVASSFPDTVTESVTIEIGNSIAKPVATNNGPICLYDTLSLAANSTTTGITYKWEGPNSFSSTSQNPVIPNPVAASGGSYILTTKLYGCVASDTTVAIVYASNGPIGTAATSNTPVCAGDSLRLFGTANGSSTTYSWTGPNSYTSSIKDPIIAATNSAATGDYILYASDGNCTSKDTVSVTIKPRPANFNSSTNAPVCEPITFSLTASSTSSGVTYAWTGPNSFTGSGSSINITNTTILNSGDYYVTATLNDCSLTDTVKAVVKLTPVKPVATANAPLCAGDTLYLTASTTTASVNYTWTGPNGFSSSAQNPIVAMSTVGISGSYIVTANLNGCFRADTVAVVVKPAPAKAMPSNNSPLCVGDLLQLNLNVSTTGATFSWTGPNGFTSSTKNPTISNSMVSATGWYKVLVDLNGCGYIDSTNVIVHSIPSALSLSYNNPICLGQTLNLNANTATGGTYSWIGPNSFTSSLQNPIRNNMQYADTGKYTAIVTVNGCTSSATNLHVSMNPQPFVVIFSLPGDTICPGENVTLTAIPNSYGGTPTYQWYINNAPQPATGVTFSSTMLNDKDIIRCDMSETTKCSGSFTDMSNDVTMNVLSWLAPAVTFTADPNRPLKTNEYVTFTATTKNAGASPQFQWKRNGQNVQGATSAIWSANTLNDNDSISVEIISDYRCPQPPTTSANGIKVKVLSGIGDVLNVADLTLYPNPNDGHFILNGRVNTNEKLTLTVINIMGQVVYKQAVQPVNNTINHSIKMDNLSAGGYLLHIQTQSGKHNMKFIVQ